MYNQHFNSDEELDKYEIYADQFDPLKTDRKARRKRKPKVKHNPKKAQNEVIAEIADTTGIEGDFTTTYQPARYEAGWLLDSLRPFYDEELIIDVLSIVKGGKEASVYRCEAHAGVEYPLLAAKVYRPRRFRNLRNDKMYRDGRAILTAEGRTVKKNDHRVMRALGKKSEFGAQVEHTSWLMYEFTTLQRLYQAGAAVPQPVAVSENAVLMEFIGDAFVAAPALNEIDLGKSEADSLFREVMRNIELMLQQELIHGDLSAYNILYWDGSIKIIDFPQVISSRANQKARFILERDIVRVCDYFAQQGVICDSTAVMTDLWSRYVQSNPLDEAADESRQLAEIEMLASGNR